jgi:hypothetical protein
MVSYPSRDSSTTTNNVDGELIEEFTQDLVNNKQSRDGIPHSLLPMRSKDLPYYRFSLKGQTQHNGGVWLSGTYGTETIEYDFPKQ